MILDSAGGTLLYFLHFPNLFPYEGYNRKMATLREYRMRQNLLQSELAYNAGLGKDTINRLEEGKQKPTAATVYKLAKALGVEPGELDFPQQSKEGTSEIDIKIEAEELDRAAKSTTIHEKATMETEVEEIVIEDRYANRLRPPLQSKEESEEPPAKKLDPEPKVEMARTNPTRTAKAESNALVEPGKASLAVPTIAAISLLDTNKWWVWLLVLLGICIAVYLLLRWDAGRGEATSLPKGPVKTKSGDRIRDYMDNL